jgi:chromate reductase, NAD(P)H dehydrogenase (quinone)
MAAGAQLDVLVICGSLRKGSYNAALVRTLPALAPTSLSLHYAQSFANFPIYNTDIQSQTGFPAEVNAWADAIRSADGLIIVSPEYNWSIPGGLKNAIDWVSRMTEQPFKDKPVALQSAAGGILGGSRAQYHLRQCLTSVDAILFGRPEVIVTFAQQKFDEKTLELKDQSALDLIR